MITIHKINPVIDYSVRGLCLKPYNGNKRCPNYGKKNGCPPGAPLFDKVYDFNFPFYAIVHKFDLQSHSNRLKTLHPDWSQRQLECCLYWQNTVRKELHDTTKDFLKEHFGYSAEDCPEAMGVEVTKTLAPVGVILEWPPKIYVHKVVIVGVKLSMTPLKRNKLF